MSFHGICANHISRRQLPKDKISTEWIRRLFFFEKTGVEGGGDKNQEIL